MPPFEMPMTQGEMQSLQTRMLRDQAATIEAQRQLCELNLATARELAALQLEEHRQRLASERARCQREVLELEHRIAQNGSERRANGQQSSTTQAPPVKEGDEAVKAWRLGNQRSVCEACGWESRPGTLVGGLRCQCGGKLGVGYGEISGSAG